MTETTENLILERLPIIRGDLRQSKDDHATLKQRIASVEAHIARLHGDNLPLLGNRDRVYFNDHNLPARGGPQVGSEPLRLLPPGVSATGRSALRNVILRPTQRTQCACAPARAGESYPGHCLD